jgi:hypothetical protein
LRSAVFARTVADMSERTTDYPGRIWLAYGPDAAAGYEHDALGDWVLMGLVIYGPTTAKLRGARLRDLEESGGMAIHVIVQDSPPTPEQVAKAWAHHQHYYKGMALVEAETAAMIAAGRAEARQHAVDQDARPEALARVDGEDPDDFYRRVAHAHRALSAVTKRPTTELARRAGVPEGTAAAWVSRARARGWIEEGTT